VSVDLCVLVSHSHWDREWYRTFQAFRARLVDLLDRVLDLCASDPRFRFVLDGQTIVVEDYLAIRPGRRADLEAACRSGRIAIGPWYVQPDSLLPSGEAHVRNLLEGRATGAAIGGLSRVAYCPDSFGHPAQFPQLFRGFGLAPFVYWRGNGDEVDALSADWTWEAPDGSVVPAHLLFGGYFAAGGLPADPEAAAAALAVLVERLAARTSSGVVLLMNGFDHALPDAHAGAVAAALARRTGATVVHGLLDDFAAARPAGGPRFRGDLLGARVTNLLPGVWSARLPLKLRNRRAEATLEGWAEPWAALAAVHGAPDERPALRAAWRALLENQAHDSIGGCATDRVHAQMEARYDAATELAEETTARALERVAGLGLERATPWTDEAFDVAVFNPSAHRRTDLVRFALAPDRWLRIGLGAMELHPWLRASVDVAGFTADGRPARLVVEDDGDRLRLRPDAPPLTVELVAADVPAFGWVRVRLAPAAAHPDAEDDGREIAVDGIAVRAAADGTIAVDFGTHRYAGLLGLEDVGDRGDAYDCDPLDGGDAVLDAVRIRRRHAAHGVASLTIRRTLLVPRALAPDRLHRAGDRVPVEVETEVRLVPGTGRVDVDVRVANTACDHRLRLLFPTGAPAASCEAATTFDVARRPTAPRVAPRWVHPAPATFPHQGFVTVNGLTVAAPGLPEAEVTPDGVVALTLVRAVGWLARMDLRTRPRPAGPAIPTPGAQCLGAVAARLALFPGLDPRRARDAELGLRAVAAGDDPLLAPGRPLLAVEPRAVLVSALKPAVDGDGTILRLSNPTDEDRVARVRFGFPVREAVPVALDEHGDGRRRAVRNGALECRVPAHALRSFRLR